MKPYEITAQTYVELFWLLPDLPTPIIWKNFDTVPGYAPECIGGILGSQHSDFRGLQIPGC